MRTSLIISTLCLVLYTNTFAQIKKHTVILGGSIGGSISSSKSDQDFPYDSFIIENKRINLNILPQIGYFLTDEILIGFGVGYTWSSNRYILSSSEEKTTYNMFKLTPLVRYNQMIGENIGFWGQINIGYAFGKTKHKGNNYSTDSDVSQFDLNFSPGILYFVSKHLGVEAKIGRLGYSRFKESDNVSNHYDFSIDFSDIAIGINYYFGKE